MRFLNSISFASIIVIALIFTSCKNNGKTISDSANSDNEYEFVDDPPIEEDVPGWQYKVLVEEDKAENPGEDYLHVGGFEYDNKIALRVDNGWVAYNPNVDYSPIVKSVFVADKIIKKYQEQKSEDKYPSKADWEQFESGILSYISDEIPDWSTIPDAKFRKLAGDFYGSIKNVTPVLYSEGAGYQIYKCDFDTLLGDWTYYFGFGSASKGNKYNIPEGALIVSIALNALFL